MKFKKTLKNRLEGRPYLLRALTYFYNFAVLYGRLLVNILRLRYPVNRDLPLAFKKPKILQFPITNRCNLHCKMCGLENQPRMTELTPEQFRDIFRNPLFSNIDTVGINGGEPFLQKNLLGYLQCAIDSLPKLRSLYLISNGTVTTALLTVLPQVKEVCSQKGIKVMFTISVDGLAEIHDLVRGKTGSFTQVEKSCAAINAERDRYCDQFGLLCTITKHNIYEVTELDAWARLNGYCISYNLATQHARLSTETLQDDFTVFVDEHTRLMTTEFFYGKFLETKSPFYFALYKYLSESKRASGCNFKYDGITVLADGSIAYCATKSKVIGNAVSEDAEKLFGNNRPYRNDLIRTQCEFCSHYTNTLLFDSCLQYNAELLKLIGLPFKFA